MIEAAMSGKEEKLEFILFLEPNDGHFYSYCASKGIIVKEEGVPYKITTIAEEQIEELKTCIDM